MYVLSNMWFLKLIRSLFFSIDKIVYGFISTIYDLLISISRTSVLTQSDIADMADRIYELLTIFMVFKVTFSLIMYVVNPDDFSDKNKGISKISTNIIFSLSFLILTPYIFNYAYQFQSMILNDNAIASLIFGEDSGTNAFNTAGDDMSYITISPFFTPNVSLPELHSCLVLTDDSGHVNEDCQDGLDDLELNSTIKANYVNGVYNRNLGLMFREKLATSTTTKSVSGSDEQFIMEYKYLFSTIVGVVIVLLLLSFCMDVAVRSIKLAFLQLIAPIPIISYVDPKGGKDGMFKKWYQLCIKTYLSLFIRLLALYFGVYIIGKVDSMVDIVDGSYVTNGYVKIFIVIGALMFAKQLPKMLEGLGIKLDGDGKFSLNPLKKFGNEALGGRKILGLGAAAGAAGLAGGVNLGTRLFDKNNWKNKDGKLSIGKGLVKATGSSIAGAGSALYRGSKKTMAGEKPGKIFSSSYGEAMFAKLQREDLQRKGSTLGGRLAADFHRATGTLNAAQQQTLDYGRLESDHKLRMETLKHESEVLNRRKTQEARELNDKNTALSRINDRISSTKSVKDADEKITSLKNSGRYYAKAGELNAAGVAAKRAMDENSLRLRNNEIDISKKVDMNNTVIANMKSNGSYYQKDENGNLVKDEKGNYKLTDQARIAEQELKDSQEEYNKARAQNDEEIAKAKKEFESNKDYYYQEDSITEEGKMADAALDEEKKNAFNNLRESDNEIRQRIKQLKDLGMDESKYIKSDGSFNKAAMFDIQNEIKYIDAKYIEDESRIAQEQAREQENFEQKLKDSGRDKGSPEWLANEADNAARKVKQPQPEGWMPSPEVNRSSYVYDPKLSGFPEGMTGQAPGPGSHRRR